MSGTPSAASEGPTARTSRGLLPDVPVPPRTVPIVKSGSAAEMFVRIERLMSRLISAVVARESVALALVPDWRASVTTTL